MKSYIITEDELDDLRNMLQAIRVYEATDEAAACVRILDSLPEHIPATLESTESVDYTGREDYGWCSQCLHRDLPGGSDTCCECLERPAKERFNWRPKETT